MFDGILICNECHWTLFLKMLCDISWTYSIYIVDATKQHTCIRDTHNAICSMWKCWLIPICCLVTSTCIAQPGQHLPLHGTCVLSVHYNILANMHTLSVGIWAQQVECCIQKLHYYMYMNGLNIKYTLPASKLEEVPSETFCLKKYSLMNISYIYTVLILIMSTYPLLSM